MGFIFLFGFQNWVYWDTKTKKLKPKTKTKTSTHTQTKTQYINQRKHGNPIQYPLQSRATEDSSSHGPTKNKNVLSLVTRPLDQN